MKGRKPVAMKGRKPVRIDKDELSTLGGVEFEWCDIPILVEVTSDYVARFREPVLPDFMLKRTKATISHLEARRAFVDAVEAVWRERCHQANPAKFSALGIRSVKGFHHKTEPTKVKLGGLSVKGWGAYSTAHDEAAFAGPLIRLLQYLLRAGGEPKLPSAATLHHDLQALAKGKERKRGKPHGRAKRKAREVRQPGSV